MTRPANRDSERYRHNSDIRTKRNGEMALKLLVAKKRPFLCISLLSHFTPFCSSSTITAASPHDVNEISRLLSDFRHPHHDLESSLAPFSPKLSTDLVEQVLKRCNFLGFSAHRFFNWAKSVPGFHHSVSSHRILVSILLNTKQFPYLWDFLNDVRDSKCCAIDSDLFGIVFRGYSRANLSDDAIRAFRRMPDFGVTPTVDDLERLLFALCKRKHVKSARVFFDEVKLGFKSSPKSYTILIRGFGDVGELDSARELFHEMIERGCDVDVHAYNGLLEALCKCGNVEEAYGVFREMGDKGIEPDGSSYSTFIRAHCEGDDLHSAFGMLDRMKRYDLVPNLFTYNCIIKRLCKSGRVDEAYLLLDEMTGVGVYPDIWSYNTILAFHCDHSEVNKSMKLIDRMEKDSLVPDRHTYNMVLKMLLKVGRLDRLEEFWDSLTERGFYPSVSTYSVMVHGLSKKKGKLEDACKYFERMIDEGIPPYLTTVEMLRNRLLGLGLKEEINILADKMKRSTSQPIQELGNTMRGNKTFLKMRNDETESESDC